MRAIHQFSAGFSDGDAIANEARVLRALFHSWGHASEIFSETRRIPPEYRGQIRDVAAARAAVTPDDIVILHLSIGSVVNDVFAELKCRKAIIYHNITPPEFFRGIQEEIARQLEKGRDQARRLAGIADVSTAVSGFNARELEAWGYKGVKVLPLILDLSRLRERPSRRFLRKYDDGAANVLFVGRCAPNKCVEDALASFYYFQKYHEPNARFIHVGSYAGTEKYHALLLTQMRDWGLARVDLVGSVQQDELNALYRSADLFLCESEHEGFCIPLIESMVHDLPVCAYAAAAVPETLDGAGVLFREKRHDLVAEMMARLVRDGALRDAVIRRQRERLARYEGRDLAAELRQHLQPLL